MGRVEVRRLLDWGKDTLTEKGKVVYISIPKQGTHLHNSFTTSHVQAGIYPSPGEQGSVTCNRDLGRQAPTL